MILLKRAVKEYDGAAWNRLIWLGIRSSGGLLWARWQSFVVHRRQGLSLQAQKYQAVIRTPLLELVSCRWFIGSFLRRTFQLLEIHPYPHPPVRVCFAYYRTSSVKLSHSNKFKVNCLRRYYLLQPSYFFQLQPVSFFREPRHLKHIKHVIQLSIMNGKTCRITLFFNNRWYY